MQDDKTFCYYCFAARVSRLHPLSNFVNISFRFSQKNKYRFSSSSSPLKVLTSHSDMIDISIPWICLLTICWSKCNTSCILLNGNRCIQAFCWKEGKIPLRNARKSFDLAIVASLKGFWLVFRSLQRPNPFPLAWKRKDYFINLWKNSQFWLWYQRPVGWIWQKNGQKCQLTN